MAIILKWPKMAKPRTFEDSAVHSDLSYWGYWKGLQLASEGYSPINTLTQILSGRADRPSHKILCFDMKPRAWEINTKIMAMNRELYEVLVGRYCLPVDPNGQPYSVATVAPLLGISRELFQTRLDRAREQYKSMIFPQVLIRHSA